MAPERISTYDQLTAFTAPAATPLVALDLIVFADEQ